MFSSLSHRRASSSSSRSSWSEDSSAQSWSSSATSEGFDLLEPISSRAPQELAFLDSTTYVTKECNSAYVASFCSSNKIPHCPKHGIQHNPCLSLPERDSRSFETIFSSFKSATSRSGSASSSASASASRTTPSRRGSAASSIKCYVQRAVSHL
ncbi:BZ3500_MvSof-1268-A1-R1_Chr11-3g03578 [Microbotryum saponariae]|uniref:BZ3500_MvSof-1268-A1-R1_Chr11-3g03578 protein n=1 Tax=Microbotryum saponariae TaxID=289078 RepID=A0A2X0LGD2_9BASI|nr:BZ3500_MvSof-1268-A1-R1_Chr11-3g03578 [Microbotryum saponariae]SDA03587.1 BZ3501_MvSof-1269-A2-R1_Chr11g03155 [Microbotryum saponariae]